jgi:predicted permease
MNDLLLDLRYALRSLWSAPGFALAAALTLALGIGANTAILSVVDGVLLRPTPFDDLDRLAMVWETDRASGTTREPASVPDYFDFVEQARSFTALAAFAAGETTLAPDAGDPMRLDAMLVTHEFMPMVGIEPLLGRAFTPDDDRPGAANVALIGESLWERLYERSPAAIGSTLRADGTLYTIVGILPAGADFGTLQVLDAAAYGRAFADRFGPADVQLWVPLRPALSNLPRDTHPIFVLGRLSGGTSLAAAQQEMTRIAADLEAAYPANDARGVNLEPLATVVFGPVKPAMVMLMAAVGLVLLVACVNVANLLLARGAARTREVAVRVALGANQGRLARQFLVEGLALAFLGGAVGVALAAWGTRLLVALAPADIPRLDAVGVNGFVLLVTTGVCAAVGVAFGLVPALHARGLEPHASLRGAATGSTSGGAGHGRFRTGLVVAELTLAVALVAGAGLLIKSFWQLRRVDPGFEPRGVLKAQVDLPPSRYPANFANWPNFAEIHQFNRAVLERVAALPGVTAGALAGNHPLDAGFANSISIPGREAEAASWPEVSVRRVSPGYAATLRLPLLRGRALSDADDTFAPAVTVVNDAAVRLYFPDTDPIGQQIFLWGTLRTVVGVVGNERTKGLAEPPPPALYLPLAQAPPADGNVTILLRTAGDPNGLASAVRAAIREVDPALPPFGIEALERTVGRSVSQQRFTMLLLGAFAATAIALALIGVHGVLSYLVARRRRELGLRLALGAAPAEVVRSVVREGARFTVVGVALGLGLALAGGRLLRGLLYGVSATDPVTFVVVGAAAFGAAVLASWIPARRAARVDPIAALRSE